MSRSKVLLGRVLRNLKRYGLKENETLDDEIYGELNIAQNHIISHIQPSSLIKITLETNKEYYPLVSNTVGNPPITKSNIISIKIVSLPPELEGTFDVVSNVEFVDAIVEKRVLPTGKPSVGTIIDGQLRVRPIPTVEYNGKSIELYVYKKMATTTISETTLPEVGEEFDKALELYATAQFLIGRDRNQFLSEFSMELRRLSPLTHRGRGTMSVKPIAGWI